MCKFSSFFYIFLRSNTINRDSKRQGSAKGARESPPAMATRQQQFVFSGGHKTRPYSAHRFLHRCCKSPPKS